MKDTKSHSVMECYKADARIAELEADNAKLRAALEMVEWVSDGEGWSRCPWCLRYEEYGDGHEDNCVRQALLTTGEPAESEASLVEVIGGGLSKLQSKEYRDAYVVEHIKQGIPFQLRSMRSARNWTQGTLGDRAGMPRNLVSRLENEQYGNFSINTLIRLANAFDTGLIVRFAPFSRLLNEYADLSPEKLNAVSFAEDSFTQSQQPAEPTPVLPTPAMLDAKRAVDEYKGEK